MTTPLTTPGMTGPALMVAPQDGRSITGGALKARLLVAHDHPAYASTFEMTVAPGFDVGAHVHTNGEEMFYVVAGEVDVLCFEPVTREGDWHEWHTSDGRTFLRGAPGAFMYVPPGTPHAFANPTNTTATMFFQSSVQGGHENYFVELGEILRAAAGRPDPQAIHHLEARYGTQQLTAMHAPNSSPAES